MQRLLGISCGLDVHKDIITACILDVRGREEPKVIEAEFTTMRGDLLRLRDWLVKFGCLNVAMESTGVYWKPVYEILEEVEGINLCLANAYHMRNVPGKKDDEEDAQWIASLYMCGLLNKSFVPERGIRDLREYTRFYVKMVQSRVRLINRIEKLLQTHGFKLSSVLSSIVGVSSLGILEKLCNKGEISVSDVAGTLQRGVKKTPAEIAYAINGKLSLPTQMLLRQMLNGLYSYDRQLAILFEKMMVVAEPYMSYIKLVATIPGIDILSATCIIAEIGVDMSRFIKGAGSLISWAGLSPRDDKSAGKIISRKILKGNSHIKAILCQCAWAATKTRNIRLSNWYWRNAKRLGQKKAIIAVARKLLVYVYNIIATEMPYNNMLDIADTELFKAFKLESAKQQVAMLESNTSGTQVVGNINKIIANLAKETALKKARSINKGLKSPNSRPLDLDPLWEDMTHPAYSSLESEPTPLDSFIAPRNRGRPKKNLTPC